MAKRPPPPDEIDAIFAGEPIEAMEAAKRLIHRHTATQLEVLIVIAGNKTLPIWSRIAAIYTLGFIDEDANSATVLRRIRYDLTERPEIRDHAAEALDQIAEC